MDLEMPIMNGINASFKLKDLMTKGEIPETPIVALTAYLDERENCMHAGMSDFRKISAFYFYSCKALNQRLIRRNPAQV